MHKTETYNHVLFCVLIIARSKHTATMVTFVTQIHLLYLKYSNDSLSCSEGFFYLPVLHFTVAKDDS